MTCTDANADTPLFDPTTTCPRCDGGPVVALAVNADSSFAWHECEVCRYLWAVPHGWTPHTEAPAPAIAIRGTR